MTDADYADDVALLTNTPVHTKFLLCNMEQTNKTELMYFKLQVAIST